MRQITKNTLKTRQYLCVCAWVLIGAGASRSKRLKGRMPILGSSTCCLGIYCLTPRTGQFRTMRSNVSGLPSHPLHWSVPRLPIFYLQYQSSGFLRLQSTDLHLLFPDEVVVTPVPLNGFWAVSWGFSALCIILVPQSASSSAVSFPSTPKQLVRQMQIGVIFPSLYSLAKDSAWCSR